LDVIDELKSVSIVPISQEKKCGHVVGDKATLPVDIA
jgi:hypothetical protein